MKKRILAMALALCLLLNNMPLGVLAEDAQMPESGTTDPTVEKTESLTPQVKFYGVFSWNDPDQQLNEQGQLVLEGVSADARYTFDTVCTLLPESLTLEGGKTVKVQHWSCDAYAADAAGNWPLSGEFVFKAALAEEVLFAESAQAREITVVLAAAANRTGAVMLAAAETDFTYTAMEDGAITITGYNGTVPSILEIPTEIHGAPVKYIKGTAFDSSAATQVTVAGSLTVQDNLTIPEGVTLVIGESGALTIPEGAGITINGKLVNEGTIVNNSTINGSGTLEQMGTMSPQGTIAPGFKFVDLSRLETIHSGKISLNAIRVGNNPQEHGVLQNMQGENYRYLSCEFTWSPYAGRFHVGENYTLTLRLYMDPTSPNYILADDLTVSAVIGDTTRVMTPVSGGNKFDRSFTIDMGQPGPAVPIDLQVTGGTEGRDYRFVNGNLEIRSNEHLVISNIDQNKPAGNSIIAEPGASINITLQNVNIRAAQPVIFGSDANITLEGNNTLTGIAGLDILGKPIQGPGMYLGMFTTVQIKGTGTLTVNGATGAAGIGTPANENIGSLIIESGTVIANGGAGAPGVGTLNGANKTMKELTVSGGKLIANGGTGAPGIRAKLTTGASGTGTIIASSMQDTSNRSEWSCILSQDGGKTFTVYGNQTLSEDKTIPAGSKLTIPAGTTVTIPADRTLTVSKGAAFTIDGMLVNEGTIANNGTLNGSGSLNFIGTLEPVGIIGPDLTFIGKRVPVRVSGMIGQKVTYGSEYSFAAKAEGYPDAKLQYIYKQGETVLDAKPENVGTYTVTAVYDSQTHHGEQTVTLTINSAAITGSISQTGTLTYDSTAQTAKLSDKLVTVNGQTITVKYGTEEGTYDLDAVPAFTEAGAHTVYFKATAPNHKDLTGSFTVTIGQAEIDVSGWKWDYSAPIGYTGDPKTVSLLDQATNTGFELVTVQYTDNSQTAVGTYTATAEATPVDSNNYMITGQIPNQVWEITKAPITEIALDLTAPAVGNAPQKDISGDGWTASIDWTPAVSEKFDYDTVYTATVTVSADANYAISDTVTVTGLDNSKVTKGVVTGTKVFLATVQAKITKVTPPEFTKFTAYHETAESAIAELPQTITIEAEDGTTSLKLSWTVDSSYDPTTTIENTFNWAAEIGNLDDNKKQISGSIKVTNVDGLAVNHTGNDKAITYNGNTYNVSGMFTLDAHAGTASYSIVSGGTGTGTLDGSTLTITKAGTITIKVNTAAKGIYASGEATAVLTVSKAQGSGSVTLDGWTYGESPKEPKPVSATNGTGSVTYTYAVKGSTSFAAAVPTDAGSYTVKAAFAATDLYAACTAAADFEIAKAEYDMTGVTFENATKIYNGQPQSLTISGTLPKGKDDIQVTVSYSGEAANVSKDAVTVTATFATESTNYNVPEAMTATITIKAKDISGADVALGTGLTFNGKTQTQTISSVKKDSQDVTYDVTGNIGKDAKTYTMTITGKGNFSGKVTKEFTIAPHAALALTAEMYLVRKFANFEQILTLTGVTGYPADAGTGPVLALGTKTLGDNTTATLTDGVLKLAADNTTANTDGSVVINLTGMQNYADSTITVTVKYTDKTPVTAISGITVIGAGKTYDSKAVAYTGTPTAKAGNQVVQPSGYTYTWQKADGTVLDAAPVNAGSYKLVVAVKADDTKYIGSVTIDFSIEKAVVTITAENKSAHIGSAQPTNTYKVSGLVGEDKLAGSVAFTDNAANMNTAGNYSITPAGGNAGENYTIQYKAGTLTVEDHSWNTQWSKDETNHWHECSVCHAHKDQAVHTWNAPEFVFAADGKSATAKTSCACGQLHEEAAVVTSEITTAATCSTKGTTTYTAKVNLSGTEYTGTTTRQDVAIDPNNHNNQIVKVDAKGAACTESGMKEHYKCSGCGKLYMDAEGLTEITLEEVTIKALGHQWGEPIITFSEDGKTAAAVVTCEHDKAHTQNLDAKVTSQVKTPATKETMGITTYTATLSFEGKTYTASKDVQDIPKIKPAETLEKVESHKLETVPESLKDTQFNTVEKIEQAMEEVVLKKIAELKPAGEQKTIVFDAVLMITENGVTRPATKEEVEARGGITIVIPYPAGTNRSDFVFTVAHMLTMDMAGMEAGDIEMPEITLTETGLKVTLKGLSPVMVGYSKKAAPTEPTVPETTVPETNVPETTAPAEPTKPNPPTGTDVPQTGDESHMMLWILLGLVSICGLTGAVLFKKKKNTVK